MNVQIDPSADDDSSPFGRPTIGDPDVQAMARVGIVDVGSNSVRLVVFDGIARSPAYFYNEKILCGLGKGMSETGVLNPEGRQRAEAALARFVHIARGMGLDKLTVIATAAMREARDGPEFCETLKTRHDLDIRIIDGEEEARLSAQGVLLGWPGSYGLVCDIGGSSMELAEISDGAVGRRVSSDLGPLKLQTLKGGRKARLAHIQATMEQLATTMGPQSDRLFLVGGSWRAVARLDMYRRGYPLHVLHEYRMTRGSVVKTLKFLREHDDHDTLRSACRLSPTRMALLPYATDVLDRLVKTFQPKDIAISAYGIREGLLYEQMPDKLRACDPLIEACRYAEAKDARLPGFGRQLFGFVFPLFKSASPARMRIIKAACLLHDVSWRAHPDYRAEACFDYATRANLGGLKHTERVFLGLALLHRYSSKREHTKIGALCHLLTEREVREAEILGRAMRFGAMLWTGNDKEHSAFRWFPTRRVLEFHIKKSADPLFGEVAQARLSALAKSLEAELVIKRHRSA